MGAGTNTLPPGLSQADLRMRFRQLADQWKRDSLFLSSVSDMVALPSYQEIIRLGEPAVPLLLAELEQTPDQWFAALRAITGVDPVTAEDRGPLEATAAAWLRWGREKGYRW